MALAINDRGHEGILILALAGQLTIGREDAVFRTVVQRCIAAGKIKIILDCSRLRNIDSAGLGTLVYFDVKLRRAGGMVVLLNITKTHMELSVLARLDIVFEMFADEQEAVNSFFPERAMRRYDVLEFVQEQARKQDGGVSDS